jgi:ribulose-5-phosphate 4-epimerase/fuculose-1-phosphate aldolase
LQSAASPEIFQADREFGKGGMSEQAEHLRQETACAARAFASLGFVHAFGHVSARCGSTLLITPTRPPLAMQRDADILEADFDGKVLHGEANARPLEIFLHIGIYRARPDVAAICRTHAPAASLWPPAVPPILHGFGGIAASVATFDEVDLIHNPLLGAAAAAALGNSHALILRGNGVLAVGASVGEAAARMWSLEERCAVALRQGPAAKPFSAEELQARRRWYPAEQNRIWTWLQHLGGGAADGRAMARSLHERDSSS